jgi:hypothetical protein
MSSALQTVLRVEEYRIDPNAAAPKKKSATTGFPTPVSRFSFRWCIALTLDIQLLREEIEYSRKYPTENLAS